MFSSITTCPHTFHFISDEKIFQSDSWWTNRLGGVINESLNSFTSTAVLPQNKTLIKKKTSKLKTWQELITIRWAAPVIIFFPHRSWCNVRHQARPPWKHETLRCVENVSSALSSKQAEAVGPSSDMMVKFSCKCHTVYNIYEQRRFVYYWQTLNYPAFCFFKKKERKTTFYDVIHGFVFQFSVDELETFKFCPNSL